MPALVYDIQVPTMDTSEILYFSLSSVTSYSLLNLRVHGFIVS